MKLGTDRILGDATLSFFYKLVYWNCTTTISALYLFIFKLDFSSVSQVFQEKLINNNNKKHNQQENIFWVYNF